MKKIFLVLFLFMIIFCSLYADSDNKKTSKSKTGKAVLFSALIPGTGEFYLGEKTTAQFFWAADGLLWLGYAASVTMENLKEDDYILFSETYADVKTSSADNDFYINLGKYSDVYEYNESVRNKARDLYIINSDQYWDYISENSYNTEEVYWKWTTEERLGEYQNLRYDKRQWNKRVSYVVTALIANRLISVIDVLRISRKIGKDENMSWDIDIVPEKETYKPQVIFSLNWR